MQQKLTGISHNFQFAFFHAERVKIDADRVKCYVLKLLSKFWCQIFVQNNQHVVLLSIFSYTAHRSEIKRFLT